MMATRRSILSGAAGLTVSFSLPIVAIAEAGDRFTEVDAWLNMDRQGRITVYCGKAELGTGVSTALAQLVADELDVGFDRVKLVLADTSTCPNQLPTFGSLTIYRAGPELRRAAANARAALVGTAAQRLGVPAEKLLTREGAVVAPDGQSIAYPALLKDGSFDHKVDAGIALKTPDRFKVIGQSMARVDIPAKIHGAHPYVHDHRVDGMLHGRVCRAALADARVARVDDSALARMPGQPRMLRKGNFVGVVAATEIDAIRAAAALKIEWQGGKPLGTANAVRDTLLSYRTTDTVVLDRKPEGNPKAAMPAKVLTAEYVLPFQMHAPIGPSCAIADVKGDGATLWSPTQSSFLTRDSVATLLGLNPDKVRLIWMEGSGCYGQNGADDCTGDAALLSQLAGKPVRVQWMRRDEHAHEPKGPAMVIQARAAVDRDGRISDWNYEAWSPTHSSRPFASAAGNMLAGMQLGMAAKYAVVGGDYNIKPSYTMPRSRVVLHLTEQSQLRASALRALGSVHNTFAIESLMDELAAASGQDPIAFRLRHLDDTRSRGVLEEVARMSKWQARPSPSGSKTGRGRGVAFVHYNNYGAHVAVVVDVRVDAESAQVHVERVFVAHDCGLIVNPDGLRNQIEGNVIQALSRALLESVSFGPEGVRALDWSGYPILRFSQLPKEIRISLLNRPDQPSVGAGEQATCPVFPAVANAIFDATGARLRQVPFSPDAVRAALRVNGRAP